MGTLTFAPNMLPRNPTLSVFEQNRSLFASRRRSKKKNLAFVPVARLFGPAIFEASKLRVLYLGVDEKKHPGKLPRTYTLTHSDITSKLTLAISQTINNSQLQGWANKFYRDEVVAEWKKVKGKMSLHVHCHISGGHFLLDLCAQLRYFIFCKELPVVLKAFVHGDDNLLQNYPELKGSLVWVYFHSNIPEFNRVECWGPLVDTQQDIKQENLASTWELPQPCQDISNWELPQPCQDISKCECCFPHKSLLTKNEQHGSHNQEQLPLPNLETIE